MAELAPSFAKQIEEAISAYEWHPAAETVAERRYSPETIAALHQALDMVLDHAPSTAVGEIAAKLERFAATFGSPEDPRADIMLVPVRLVTEIKQVANEYGLDMTVTLRKALSRGLPALSQELSAERQRSSSKEAYKRVNPRSR